MCFGDSSYREESQPKSAEQVKAGRIADEQNRIARLQANLKTAEANLAALQK
jgi:hypothetical protein